MKFFYSALTDIGLRRSTNQDSILAMPDSACFAVADGMGGHKGGDRASQLAVAQLKAGIEGWEHLDKEALASVINSTNSLIYKESQENQQFFGMGTTLVFAGVSKQQILLANIGDSRAYLFVDQQSFQLTRDHSLVQEKLDQNFYERPSAKLDRQKNVLTRSLGVEAKAAIDYYYLKPVPNSILMLCSDGLHGCISPHDLNHSIAQFTKKSRQGPTGQNELEILNRELVQLANSNGGKDNISSILLYFR